MSSEAPKLPPALNASARLTREAGILAGRLAEFLEVSFAQAEGTMAEAREFLRAFFESVSPDLPLDAWSRDAYERSPETPQPLDRLARSLGFSAAEVELLLLAGLSEEHEGLAAVLRHLHPRNESWASVGLAAQLLYPTQSDRQVLRALLESSSVVRSGALRVTGEVAFFERSLQPAEALWSALHGIDVWPSSVTIETGPPSAGLDDWFETQSVRQAVIALQQNERCTVMVTADNDDVAFDRAMALVARAGAKAAGIVLAATPEADREKLIQVHALTRGVVPVLKLATAEGAAQREVSAFREFPGAVIASGRSGTAWAHDGRPMLSVLVEHPTPLARQRMWREIVPAMAEHAGFLAARYAVEPTLAAAVAADLKFVSELEKREPTIDDVVTCMRARGSISISAGVRMIRPRAGWNDLVLPADRLQQLREAVSRLELQARVFDEWGFLRNRTGARGVRLLFTGPPGTGKTLAAEVLSHALKVDLLVVDLSRVVSKWIGETEKNLAAVFEAAERGQAALFFDEADALFGKRTEVSDAHDRYANLETAYLLTRLEQFEGLAILATNLRANIDPAFLRRLEFVIDFEEPDREERLALWNCHMPKDAPLADDVNLYELAALYPVVGGVIRNAAVAAGFLAAADGAPIDRHHFVHAIRREYAKAGRSFPGVPIGLIV